MFLIGERGDFFVYTPMQEVTPKVVAMAVSTVITMFRILLQISLFMVLNSLSLCFWVHHRVHRVPLSFLI